MIIVKRIYSELKTLIKELKKVTPTPKVLQEVNENYVLRYLTNSDLLALLRNNQNKLPTLNEALLKEPAILEQVIKIIALMEVSDTWQDFEKLIAKRKTDNVTVDFDKILKALLKTSNK